MGQRNVVLLDKGELGEGATAKTGAILRHHYSNEVTIRMTSISREILENSEEEIGERVKWVMTGMLILAEEDTDKPMRENIALHKSVGIDVDIISPEEVRKIYPEMNFHGITSIAHERKAGYTDSHELVQAYAKAARNRGAEIIPNTAVTDIRAEGGEIQSVVTDKGEIKTSTVVIAAGPWAKKVGMMAGVDLPISNHSPLKMVYFQPTFHYEESKALVLDWHNVVVFRPDTGGIIMANSEFEIPGEFDPDDYDESVEFEVVSETAEKMVDRYPPFKDAGYIRGHTGIDGVSPDFHPIIGRVPEVDGLYCDVAGGYHSFKLAPAIGRLMAELIVDGKASTLNIDQLSIDRFKTGKLMKGKYEKFKLFC
ncbi:MAG: FAD-dependent oxidoreductase [Nitrososphaeria archaeon]|nr:FAD-dependent oxidoreductase [Nitrososphaeria archaeon]